ncbi:hypothetical protein MSG28_012636 [Choristoneura fumiferana]|uniref:Uncharacterized protein n=1 Tax=Choristoneura fumiferana TaxID=7141 RepID=A0ACC0JHK7_CHOFU|nr:hypothetical protein MSG28_012636 [Choristoneura fumiferana]
MMSPTGVGVVSHLNISRTRVEDGGLYSCTAIEGESSVSHSARIDVYGPPYIRSLPPIKVQSGEPLKLRCPYYGFPISKLDWEYKGKKILTTITSQRVRYKRSNTKRRKRNTNLRNFEYEPDADLKSIQNSEEITSLDGFKNNGDLRIKRQLFDPNEDGVLSIPRVVKEGSGELYTCIVHSPSGEMARRSFEIQVVEAPELDELRVGSGLKEGQIVQITCNIISGDPPIYFSWLKDGKKMPASLKITERSSELFSVLIIKRVSLEHCGKYTCIATNHVGKVNQTADLYINEPVHFESVGANLTTKMGLPVTLTCRPLGDNPIRVKWSLNAPSSTPLGVQVQATDSPGELTVSWLPPPRDSHNGHLQGYHVKAVPRIGGDIDGPWQNITTPHTEVYLQTLLKYTNYTIKVAGFSNYGLGPFSWKKPTQPNGEITHYTVHVKPVSSTSSPQSYRVDATQESNLSRHLTFPLSGLTTGRQYEVFVNAHTVAGEGIASNRVHAELSSRVVAGVASLGGTVSVGVGRSLLLACACAGAPAPRTVWYHNHNIITHHPRFTRNHDDSLLINNIDQSLSGNYTCLAKNLYGSDSVSYEVTVLPTPEPPSMRVSPHKHALRLQWDAPRTGGRGNKITYNLAWKEANGAWQDAWTNKGTTIQGAQEYTLQGLKCGTKYSLKMTASNSVGASQPTFVDATTLGGTPISTEWFWSNSTHIFIQLSGWDDNGCEITRWDVEYREYLSKVWKKAENKLPTLDQVWSHYIAPSILNQPNSFVIADLMPAQWYQIKIIAENSAGDTNHHRLTEYRNSLTAECKSERSNVTVNTPQSAPAEVNNRVYSTPVHLTADSKHEGCRIQHHR